MKKILFLVIISYMATGCNDGAKDEKTSTATDSSTVAVNVTQKTTVQMPPIDWTKYTSTSQEDVAEMAAHYLSIIDKSPELGIQQINMDGEMLEALLVGAEGLKLIATADIKSNKISMYMQFWKGGVFSYYDIDSFFNPTQRGMRGQPALCPPPPGCELPLVKSVRPNIMTETEADEMAKHYNMLVKKDPSIGILQVTMDAVLLELLSIGTEGLKLIYAADLKNNKPTVIMQFWKGGSFYYFNIKDIFTPDMKGMRGQYPLCPPPEGCDLPFAPKKVNSKK